MCGIAGIVSFDGFEPRKLIAMTQMISYRGPDAYGFAYAGRDRGIEVHHGQERMPASPRPQIGLGNRRLAILDLSAIGNQPMWTGNGRFCITYNGEVYNYREIREELSAIGHGFTSNTDTEVVLRSYETWGERCLQRLNGMWSFAIWDQQAQKLFCARDRFGVKPFYYSIVGNSFYFGSEIKQILAASDIRRTPNVEAITDFLELGLQDHLGETSFAGIFQLLGGHCLTLELANRPAPKIVRYWELQTTPEWKITPAEAADKFRKHFSRAVRLRLRSDVPVGISLSGGLDSAAIACEARRVSPKKEFACFSACFEDSAIDEREYMEAVTSTTQNPRYWVFPQAESFWREFDEIAYQQDEPIGGPSVFAQWSVMNEARKARVPVLLGGQGGDESLCGYRKYYFFYLWHLIRTANPAFIPEGIAVARNLSTIGMPAAAVMRYLPRLAQRRLSGVERLGTDITAQQFASGVHRMGASRTISERQKIDLVMLSIPRLLRHEDRNSMAHSIESRMPFLDYELVEFLVRCPASLKLKAGWTKWLMRRALSTTLPEKIRARKTKLGFDTPETTWLRMGLSNGRRPLWEKGPLRMEKYVSPPKLLNECSKFLTRGRGALPAEILFRAISLETWARVHEVN